MTAFRIALGVSFWTFVAFGCSSQDGGTATTGTGGAGTGGSASGSGGGIAAGSGGAGPGSGGSVQVAGTGGLATGGANAGTGGQPIGTGGGGTASGGTSGAAAAAGTGGSGAGGTATATGGAQGGGSGGAAGSSVGEVPLDASLLSKCNGSNPIRCTIPVPNNGDYNVTVELGSATAASNSRIQAELYRIEIPPIALSAGTYSKQTFSVNVRMEKHDGYSAPGMVLDLLIDGSAPALHGVGFAAATNIPTLFVIGDSTVCDWDPALASILDPLERGWAQEFSQFVKPGMAVANYADSGETAGSAYTKFFAAARDVMRAGDYLFIQFGDNDQKSQSGIDAYQSNLMKYVTDARNKGATPILFTPVARKGATTADPGFAGLDQQVRDLAAAQKIAMVDLTTLSIAYYKTVADLSSLFAGGGTHFMETGATQISGVVAKDLKAGTLPLAAFLR